MFRSGWRRGSRRRLHHRPQAGRRAPLERSSPSRSTGSARAVGADRAPRAPPEGLPLGRKPECPRLRKPLLPLRRHGSLLGRRSRVPSRYGRILRRASRLRRRDRLLLRTTLGRSRGRRLGICSISLCLSHLGLVDRPALRHLRCLGIPFGVRARGLRLLFGLLRGCSLPERVLLRLRGRGGPLRACFCASWAIAACSEADCSDAWAADVLLPRIVPLRERPDGQSPRNPKADEGERGDERQAALPALRLRTLALDGPLAS